MKELLVQDIVSKSLSYTTAKWVIEGIPFIFNGDWEGYIGWKEELSKLINVDSKAIVFTGSSSVGFSLNPSKNLRAFDEESDVDVAIVSDHYFNISWHYLRHLGTKIYSFNRSEVE